MQHLFYVVMSASLFVLCQSEINFSVKGAATTLWKIPTNVWKIPTNVWNEFWNFYHWFFCRHCSSETTCPEPECPTPSTCPEPECPDPQKCPETESPPTCPGPECPTTKENVKFVDCSEALQLGEKESGVFTIWPKKLSTSLDVYCDMDTDGGGWTVIQRRGIYSTPKDYFYKDWESYKLGFGDITEEFWIGNDNIHAISTDVNTTIRFDLEDAKGVTGYAHYDTFWIDDEISNYTIHISGYTGDVGDGMLKHNNMMFSSNDRDNDIKDNGNCVYTRQGPWWHFDCAEVSLNGLNQPGKDSITSYYWRQFRKYVGLGKSEMKLRPL